MKPSLPRRVRVTATYDGPLLGWRGVVVALNGRTLYATPEHAKTRTGAVALALALATRRGAQLE